MVHRGNLWPKTIYCCLFVARAQSVSPIISANAQRILVQHRAPWCNCAPLIFHMRPDNDNSSSDQISFYAFIGLRWSSEIQPHVYRYRVSANSNKIKNTNKAWSRAKKRNKVLSINCTQDICRCNRQE